MAQERRTLLLYRGMREGLSDGVTFEQRLKKSKGVSHVDHQGRYHSGRGNSSCKGSEVGRHWLEAQ